MPLQSEDYAQLALMVERLLDAELLAAGEGGALLSDIALALRCQEEGKGEAARGHLTRLARSLEALARAPGIEALGGQSALDSARRLLLDAGD